MRNFFRKLLFGEMVAQQYITVAIEDAGIQEKFFLISDKNSRRKISTNQFVLCQKPFIIGVWCREKLDESQSYSGEITDQFGKRLLKMRLAIFDTIEISSGIIVLFHLVRSHYYFINKIHQKSLVAYFYLTQRHKVSFYELDCFCAAYTYPRKVILACAGQPENGTYNVFPMDLQGFIADAKIQLLGLRNTNVTLSEMLNSKRAVICEIDARKKNSIFSLGKHHSTRAPSLEDFEFNFTRSYSFNIPIPSIIDSYKEVEIVHSLNVGTHTIMVAKVINEITNQEGTSPLHHIHIAYGMQTNYKPV